MLKGLFVAAIACCLSMPATAGDKPKVKSGPVLVSAAGAVLRSDTRVSAGRAAAGAAASRRAGGDVFVLPPAPGGLERRVSSATLLRSEAAERPSRIDASLDAAAQPRPEVTGSAGGSYAVRDYFAAQPRPRQRRSPLGAMFVLRLDGQEESPSFSVGGGGVPAALWGVMPKR
jgi:hypothetical protein